jgi:hypothetical protein
LATIDEQALLEKMQKGLTAGLSKYIKSAPGLTAA